MNGTVKFFNSGKGFGFITGEDGQDVFVHQTALEEGMQLRDNDQVTFDIEQGERGPKAVNVKKVDSQAESPAESQEDDQEDDQDMAA